MEKPEFFDFNLIQGDVTSEEEVYLSYLKAVYKDLSDRSENKLKIGISKITFLEYIKLPLLIGEKLFISLDSEDSGYLSLNNFSDGLRKLYLGNFSECIEAIFKIYDFNKDGYINSGDIKIILSYLPLSTSKHNVNHNHQMQSLDEINQIIEETFEDKNKEIDLKTYKLAVETKKSDTFVQLYCFLLEKRPFQKENVSMLKTYKKLKTISTVNTSIKLELSPEKGSRVSFISPQLKETKLISPSRKSILSPYKKMVSLSDSKNNHFKFDEEMIRMNNAIYSVNESKDVNGIAKESINTFESPSILLKKPKPISEFKLEDNLINMCIDNGDNDIDDQEPIKVNKFEDVIYKLSNSKKIKKYWLMIVGKDIYYYRNEKKEELEGLHNLSGCFVKESSELTYENAKYYSFTITFPSKQRVYFVKSREIRKEWVKQLREAIGYKSFSDYYDLFEEIGKGKFGVVKLGVHKKTNEKVAIKIIKKEAMTNKDVELVKSEIDILKLCKHPNIILLLDHFENNDFIFLVMEYLTGKDFGSYLDDKKYQISEEKASNFIFQLASGINYLHNYGIVHRDLKPENIMLSNQTENCILKIMDFGLSKIMGPDERVVDGFGTLSFVAPEVLVRKPYNRMVDIWSMGIILYFMLSGILPFDDESDEEEIIAKMVVFNDIVFSDKYWGKKSSNVIDLIKQCLEKDPEKRINVENILEHEWIKKYN